MPWCPKCKSEYRPGCTVCSDCGAALVETLPRDEEPEPMDPVLLTTLGSNSEIAMVTGLLSSAGIPFYALDRELGSYLRITMGFSVYGQDLYVEKSRLAEAQTLLEAYLGRGEDVMVFENDESLTEEPPAESGSWKTFPLMIGGFLLVFILLMLFGR